MFPLVYPHSYLAYAFSIFLLFTYNPAVPCPLSYTISQPPSCQSQHTTHTFRYPTTITFIVPPYSYFFSQQYPTNNVPISYTFLVTMPTPAPGPVQNPHIPHPTSHVSTHNTAVLQTYLSSDTRLCHVHKFTITPLYMRRAVQELKHEHMICLRAPTTLCDATKPYLIEQIINHTLQIIHEHSPYRAK